MRPVGAIAALLVLACAAAARAGTIGELAPQGKATINCGYENALYLPGQPGSQNAIPPAGGVLYTVPAGGGTITSWSVNNMDAGATVRLAITRFETGFNGVIVARSAAEHVAKVDAVNTFATHIPVHGGEQIGLDVPAVDRRLPRGCYWYTGNYYDFAYVADDRPADGQSTPFVNGEGGFEKSRVSVRATIDTRARPGGRAPQPSGVGCDIPQLRGLTLFRAEQALAARHCDVGKVVRRRSRRARAGRVISQNPSAGASLPAGGRVSLLVASRR